MGKKTENPEEILHTGRELPHRTEGDGVGDAVVFKSIMYILRPVT